MFGASLGYFFGCALNRARVDWYLFRSTKVALEEWFQNSSKNIRDPNECSSDWVIGELGLAMLARADGVVFNHRELMGIKHLDMDLTDVQGDYFKSESFKDTSNDSFEFSMDEREHSLRFRHMSRIDIYHVHKAEAHITNGVSTTLSPGIDALRAFLTKKRRISVILNGECFECQFSIVKDKRFFIYPTLHVDISYTPRSSQN